MKTRLSSDTVTTNYGHEGSVSFDWRNGINIVLMSRQSGKYGIFSPVSAVFKR